MRLRLSQLFGSLANAGHAVVEILLISAASGVVIGVLNVTGLSFNLTYLLVQIGGGNVFALLGLSAVVCIILGMGLPTLGFMCCLAALVAPALIGGHQSNSRAFVCLYFGMMSMITPPIAHSLLRCRDCQSAGDGNRLGCCAVWLVGLFDPAAVCFFPTLLVIGETTEIAVAVLTAVFGVWFVSIALAGFLVRPFGLLRRLVFAAAGLLSLIPASAFQQPARQILSDSFRAAARRI